MLFSGLPHVGRPNRLMIYDLHTLQNRFYFHSSTIPSLHSSVPLFVERLKSSSVRTVAFPDDGAAKRFGQMFRKMGFELIVCGKVRDGPRRIVKVQDGDPSGKDVVVVDDLVQTGGTLHECALVLKQMGARKVNAFVAHGVFPNGAWKLFSKKLNGSMAEFDRFWVTNSIPTVTDLLPEDDVFEVLDLLPRILEDLDMI
jgi:phosphoribosylpyrophosphate synthetase